MDLHDWARMKAAKVVSEWISNGNELHTNLERLIAQALRDERAFWQQPERKSNG